MSSFSVNLYVLMIIGSFKIIEERHSPFKSKPFSLGKRAKTLWLHKINDEMPLSNLHWFWGVCKCYVFNTGNTMQLLPHFSYLSPKGDLSSTWGCPTQQNVWRKESDSSPYIFSYAPVPQVSWDRVPSSSIWNSHWKSPEREWLKLPASHAALKQGNFCLQG